MFCLYYRSYFLIEFHAKQSQKIETCLKTIKHTKSLNIAEKPRINFMSAE